MTFKSQLDDRARFLVDQCYFALKRGGDAQAAAENVLGRRHWIHEAADFDERTGDMLPSPLSRICTKLALASDFRPIGKDRLYRIVEHTTLPLQEILRGLHERLIREHASLPIRAVRELDSASFFALSRRPGRTIREKLSDRPYMWAVERRWTVDSTENRLVKAFCVRLAYLLRTRADCRGSHDEPQLDDLLAMVESWLQSSAAKEIGRWENLPPTNFLLQHRDYRRVWDAWRWIEALDDDLRHDHDERLTQWTTIVFWSIVTRLARIAGARLLEQPCYLDYERFTIATGRLPQVHHAVIDGLMFPPQSGRVCGIVTKLGKDKNGNGFGYVAITGGRSAFFHSHMFDSASDYQGLRKDSALTFELVVPPDGKLRTANPEVLPSPAKFRLEMDQGSRIALRLPGHGDIDIKCELHGEGVQVCVGQRAVAAELSLTAAGAIADSILSAGFKVYAKSALPDASVALSTPPQPATTCVVDLCALRPRFARDEQHGVLPFRLLWQRWHPDKREPVELDLGNADAVALGTNITSVSILDLLAADATHSPAVLSQAARSFGGKLEGALGGGTLIYVVPDATDEFALSILRRSVNAAFRAAEPLPRSVAAVFAWQSSAGFGKNGVSDGDCVLVLDTVGATVSATPLVARWKKELEQRLPESAGIYWERSPCAQNISQASSTDTAVGVLKDLGCGFPEDIARLCGLQGLFDEGADLSWQHETGDWFTLPCNQEPAFERVRCGLGDPWAALGDGLDYEMGRLATGARVFVLLAGDVFRQARRRFPTPPFLQHRKVVHLGYEYEPQQGGMVLHRWQERAGDIALWRDHLPDLSMRIFNGERQVRIHLVKDVTVAPRRGQAVPIAITETFLLEAGHPDYKFTLLQGSEDNELRYEAFLKSPAFPLQDDLPVALQLTYSYGTDTPYDLVFRPLSLTSSGLRAVHAEWRPRELPSDAPRMPDPDPWAKFAKYPKRDSPETSDLLEWISSELKQIEARTQAFRRPRQTGTVSRKKPKTDVRGKQFTYVTCEAVELFCHETEFVDPADVARVSYGDVVTLDVEYGDRSPRGRRIAVGTTPIDDDHALVWRMYDLLWDMRKVPRFLFQTVWSGGHSLIDPDVPSVFRETMRAGTQTLLALMGQRAPTEWSSGRAETVHELSDEALFLLCCMHRDAPEQVANTLDNVLSDRSALPRNLRRYYRHVALALGGAELQWQRNLLARVIAALKEEPVQLDVCNFGLRILAIALWRNGKLLAALTLRDLTALVYRTDLVLREDLSRLTDDRSAIDADALKDHLELALGLLRARASEDDAIRGLLAPGRPAAKSLAQTVERTIDVVSSKDMPIRSRLTLDVEKPEALHKTPDLLFALKLYLTGDAGARAIRVMEVREDED